MCEKAFDTNIMNGLERLGAAVQSVTARGLSQRPRARRMTVSVAAVQNCEIHGSVFFVIRLAD
jgi:hypothetical protein